MPPDPSSEFIQRLRVPGLLVLGVLAVTSQGFELQSALAAGDTLRAALGAVTLLISLTVTLLMLARRLDLSALTPLILWFAGAWTVVQLVQAFGSPGPVAMPLYVSHLILVSVAYTLLPVVPATGAGVLSGLLVVVAAVTRTAVQWEVLSSVLFLAGLIGFMAVHGRPIRDQRVKTELAMDLTGTDVLTGLKSRRTGQERLQLLTRAGPKDRGRKAVVVLDVEQYGPDAAPDRVAGDDALRRAASILQAHLNEPDFACRWGASELLVVLNDTTRPAADELVDWWRTRISLREKPSHRLTLRAGVAMFTEGRSVDQVLALAEARLYSARIADREAQAGR